MKLAYILPAYSFALRIEVDDAAISLPRESSVDSEPVMHSFANHLHSVANLFSSIIGKGSPTSYRNPGCYLPETQDSQFPAWSGPFCVISYDAESSCSESFDCNFNEDFTHQLPHQAKLCCRSNDEPWSAKFLATADKLRVFSANPVDDEAVPENAMALAGHFGLTELIFNPPSVLSKPLYINKFDMGAACKMWGEDYGYYSLNPVPEGRQYQTQSELDIELSVCAVERKFELDANAKEIPSIMPFCSFKLDGQECPDYARLHLTFPDEIVHMPHDHLFQQSSLIDPTGLCCSLTQHKTVDRTVINLDYLPSNWTMNDFQVIKWPYADCPEFEFPRMELTEHQIEFSGSQEYPWEAADLRFSMCSYKQPIAPTESEDNVVTESEPEIEDEDLVPFTTEPAPASTTLEPLYSESASIDNGSGSVEGEEELIEAAPVALITEEEEYQNSVVGKLEELHAQYSEYKSNDKYEVNPFDTESAHTKLFRNRRAGCYFSTTEAFCNGESSPFVTGLQICCDGGPSEELELSSLWERPYPDDFFMIRGAAEDRCLTVSGEANESVIRQEVQFEYAEEVLKLNACIYTVVVEEEDGDGDEGEMSVNATGTSTPAVSETTTPEVRPLMGYIKTNTYESCLNEQSSVFIITQDTEDHPTDIANCSQSWIDHLAPIKTNLQQSCSLESHGLVTWKLCMGEFPEFTADYEPKISADEEHLKNNETTGFCFVKAAVVTCPDNYQQKSIRWKNEMNGNQNNYEFQRFQGVIYEKIWPGGYFGPGPELQIDFCCREVSEVARTGEVVEVVVEPENPFVISNDTWTLGNTTESFPVPEPLLAVERVDDLNSLTDDYVDLSDSYHDYKIGLVRYGDHCPLLDGSSGLPAWFDFPTEKNNDYDSTGGIAMKSSWGIKLNICLYK